MLEIILASSITKGVKIAKKPEKSNNRTIRVITLFMASGKSLFFISILLSNFIIGLPISANTKETIRYTTMVLR
jgi:cytochrome bd-type quinol oxidase subunit 2